jgi:hypothetical protein
VTAIIRSALLAFGLLVAVAACSINPSSNPGAASAGRITVTPLPQSVQSGSSVWVVSAIGLNIHSAPDVNADRLATVSQGVRLDITEKQQVAGETWLHVRPEGGTVQGWVLDQPDLVIHREVAQHVEASGGWSILFPANWSPVSGNPATFTGGTGPDGGSMLVQTATDPNALMPIPISPGRELRQESPIVVYGRTTFMTLYQSNAGGFEYDVKVQFPKSMVAYLFDFKQPFGSTPDTTLFKQLLDSVIVPGEG